MRCVSLSYSTRTVYRCAPDMAYREKEEEEEGVGGRTEEHKKERGGGDDGQSHVNVFSPTLGGLSLSLFILSILSTIRIYV